MPFEPSAFSVQEFATAGGARVFQLPLQLFPGWGGFPGMDGYVYLALADGDGGPYRVLIDAGSGLGDSNPCLEAGLQAVSQRLGRTIGLADLTHVLITHAHIDHFGGLTYVRPRTQAQIGVHELDLRVLTNYEERLTVVGRRLEEFLIEAGVSADQREHLIGMYKLSKSVYRSVQVDFTYEAAGMRLGPFEMLHTPGHCAGHVVIRLHDILFSGDHVLEDTSPHQSPEHLTLSTGLDHYLRSLDELEQWISRPAAGASAEKGIRVALGGHKQPITDLPGRIAAIRKLHTERLEKTLHLMEEAHTIREVSQALFGELHGYNVLLALEEAGAHVEYLYQRGLLGIENLSDLESAANPIPIRYRCLSCMS
jgi:glyoxylase-like metal-dependent hydrolase (beta-lactamase superfamily II)